MNWMVQGLKPLGLALTLTLSLVAQDPTPPKKPDDAKKAADSKDQKKPVDPAKDAPKATDSKSDSKKAEKPTGKPDKDQGGRGKNANLPPAPEGIPADLNAQAPYTVGVGDSLTINVWKEPEVSGQVRIRGDCRITLP